MVRVKQAAEGTRRAFGVRVGAVLLGVGLLAACSGGTNLGGLNLGGLFSSPSDQPAGQPQAATTIGGGQVKVGLILPLSAGGNAGVAAISMRNAAELALAEFSEPNVQLLVKDDGGTAQQAQQAAQEALAEGAEIILGPLFAHTVGPVGQAARQRGVPVIAFSTDINVASRGVYLLSFLPESDVDRIVSYAASTGKRSFIAVIPENAYGSAVEAAFNQAVARRGARVVTLQRYAQDAARMQAVAGQAGQAARGADAIFMPDGAEGLRALVPMLRTAGVDLRRVQPLGTGAWEDPQIFADPNLQGGWYATVDPAGFRSFSNRYRTKYGQDPVRTASLAYDAVALIAALVKTQGPNRFSEQTLTNASGFTGIDGLFRFRPDGTNQRGLAVFRVAPGGGQVVSPAPRSFGSGT